MEFKDYYRVLGIDRNADDNQIGQAYRELARTYHLYRRAAGKLGAFDFSRRAAGEQSPAVNDSFPHPVRNTPL